MKGYSILEHEIIEEHIQFLRVSPSDLKITVRSILDSFMNLSWIGSFDKDYLKSSYKIRAEESIKYISDNIFNEVDDKVTSSSGEYVVSELARLAIIEKFSYLDIPLAELFKKQKIGNPGFDFYSSNLTKHILFGEAKYLAKKNAYGSALEQINTFYNKKQHISEIAEIEIFFCEDSLSNCNNDELGFMVAFSSKDISSKKLIKNIKNNKDFKKLKDFKEIVLVAVDI